MKKYFLLLLIAEASFCLASSVDGNSHRSFSETIKNLNIEIDEGNIIIEGLDGFQKSQVFSEPASSSCVDKVEITGDIMNIINKKRLGGCICRYIVKIPRGTGVHIRSGSSDIILENLQSSVDIKSGVGSVTSKGLLDKVKVQLGTGNIDIQSVTHGSSLSVGAGSILARYEDVPKEPVDVELSAATGNVSLILPEESRVQLESPSSRIENDFPDNSSDYNFLVRGSTALGKIIIKKSRL